MERTEAVLELVRQERVRQEARYGETNRLLVGGTGPETRWLGPYTSDSADDIEKTLRSDYDDWGDAHLPTWTHLVREEVAEAFKESDPERLAAELVQVAALCVSWVDRL